MSISKTIAIATFAGATLLGGCATGSLLSDGSSRSYAQVARIEPGMTKDEVRQRLGPPQDTEMFRLSNTEAWDYGDEGYRRGFSVTFGPDGKVTSTLSEPEEGS
jgi:outer membrane protein assembly factor BamE (lipoprotein component of BamABCDE complex)